MMGANTNNHSWFWLGQNNSFRRNANAIHREKVTRKMSVMTINPCFCPRVSEKINMTTSRDKYYGTMIQLGIDDTRKYMEKIEKSLKVLH